MANTVENLKTLKQLGFGNFKVSEGATYGNSKAIWKLMSHYDKVFTDLKITDANKKAKLFKLLEFELTEAADSGILDTNADVTTKTEAYAKIQEKVKQFYGIKKLKVQARDKLSKITQGDKSANQLFVDILELWDLSEYGDDNSDEQIKEILLRALNDKEIKLQYELSQLPGRTQLTVEGIVAYANEFALHKKASHYRTNQIVLPEKLQEHAVKLTHNLAHL